MIAAKCDTSFRISSSSVTVAEVQPTIDESNELGELGDCVRHGTVHMLQDLCQNVGLQRSAAMGESDTWRKSIVVHARREV